MIDPINEKSPRISHRDIVLASLVFLTMMIQTPVLAGVSVDTLGFIPDTNGLVYDLVQQSDGKVLIGGRFTSVDSVTRNYIARLNIDGSLDMEFDPGTGANDYVSTIIQQSDGKVLIGGDFTSFNGTSRNYIARLNADGSLDTGFDPGTGVSSAVTALARDSDGKVLIGGYFTSVNGISRNYIARLNADGSLDTTFDPGAGTNAMIESMEKQSDGKVLIGGRFTSVDGTARNYIARLNADGSLDTTFDPGTGPNERVNTLALQFDGKVLIGGRFTSVDGTTRNYVARLNANGSLDTGFDSSVGANSWVFALAQQTDGKVLLGGDFSTVDGTSRNHMARLNADGSLDTGFDPGTGSNYAVFSLSPQFDGKVLFGGSFTTVDGLTHNHIARLNMDGSLDKGFDPGTGADGTIEDLALQSNGKMLICGDFTTIDGTSRNRIARLNADGSLDNSFDPGTGADSHIMTLSPQLDDKVLIGGWFTSIDGTSRNRIARLNADGSLDTAFDPGTGANSVVYAIAQLPDGKVLIGGIFTEVDGIAKSRIARLNSDGSLDTGFDPGSVAGGNVPVISPQPDGKILIGGFNLIARLNVDGSLDTSFDPGTGVNNYVYALAQQTNGKIIIGGHFTTVDGIPRNRIARLNVDGSLDTSFDPGTGANDYVFALALQADGKVVIGGRFTNFDGTPINHIARLNADGSLDTTFDPGTGTNYDVEAMAQQIDGKLLAGGSFTTFNGAMYNRIVRLSQNEAAISTLSAAADGKSVSWLFDGSSPIPNQVTFEIANILDGNWTMLGTGRRVLDGFRLSGLNLLFEKIYYIRSCGYYQAGSLTESIRQVYLKKLQTRVMPWLLLLLEED